MYEDAGKLESKAFVDRLMNMVRIEPEFVFIGKEDWKTNGWKIEPIFQQMASGNTAITLYFDTIENSIIEQSLIYPEEIHKAIKIIIEGLESGYHMNKMRSTIKILEFS
mgnify:CR=1 FL=1